jgi:hypothetical protein
MHSKKKKKKGKKKRRTREEKGVYLMDLRGSRGKNENKSNVGD